MLKNEEIEKKRKTGREMNEEQKSYVKCRNERESKKGNMKGREI